MDNNMMMQFMQMMMQNQTIMNQMMMQMMTQPQPNPVQPIVPPPSQVIAQSNAAVTDSASATEISNLKAQVAEL